MVGALKGVWWPLGGKAECERNGVEPEVKVRMSTCTYEPRLFVMATQRFHLRKEVEAVAMLPQPIWSRNKLML